MTIDLEILARRASDTRRSVAVANRLDLDFFVQDGWIYRRKRHALTGWVQEANGGIVRERIATDEERALWESLR